MSATAFAASGLHRSSFSGGALRLLDSTESDIPLSKSFGVARAVNHDMAVATGAQRRYLTKDSLSESLHVIRHESFGIELFNSCSVSTERDETKFHFLPPFVSVWGTLPLREHVTLWENANHNNVIYILKIKILLYFYFH